MNIYVFTNSKKIGSLFDSLLKDYELFIYKRDMFNTSIDSINPGDLVYYDIQGLEADQLYLSISDFVDKAAINFGIIDPKSEIASISDLFFAGFCDYISKKEIAYPITPGRIKKIRSYKNFSLPDKVIMNNSLRMNIKKADKGWNSIQEGKEYSFYILYFRLEEVTQLQNHFGYKFTESIINTVRDYLKSYFGALDGKLWITDDNKVLFLFPYKDNNHNIFMGIFNFLLNKILFSGETLKSPVIVNPTIILHLGNVTYLNEDMAGKSVSNSLNLIFHAANSYVTPGNFYLSDTVFGCIPPTIAFFFRRAPSFEGHDFMIMKNQIINSQE
ncbi:MAG: hypothetical protein JXK07_05690 [Spirochaetes bacterium]|nr:hypothetical protein [Spirochaetota bacterium]MBN2769165.1 hypothetical protein [Spirochaetota bacterium]